MMGHEKARAGLNSLGSPGTLADSMRSFVLVVVRAGDSGRDKRDRQPLFLPMLF